jgi:hypothetical protein
MKSWDSAGIFLIFILLIHLVLWLKTGLNHRTRGTGMNKRNAEILNFYRPE